jgi:phenylacetate-CoA ligase
MAADPIEHMIIKFRDALAETERLRPQKLRPYQESLLVPLILHAQRNVPFYKDRLAPICKGSNIDLSFWNQVPILSRTEVQRQSQALAAQSVPPEVGPVSAGETSGSSGRPIHFLTNELAKVATMCTTDRTFRWWNFDGSKSMATLVARSRDDARPPNGKTEVGWRIGEKGLHHLLDLSADADMQIEWLRARRPQYLTAHSFVLREVADRARVKGADLHFERINSIGTVLSDEIRDACLQVFGTRPIDQYGAEETGLLASECPGCGHYHINAETALVEILTQEGTASSPGAVGRVVVTPFYNYAMPLIRYEIGDFARAGPERLKCLVKLPALSRIMGRYRNAFTLRTGAVIYPYVPVSRLRQFLSFEQIQIVQTSYTAIEVRYVPSDRTSNPDAEGLETCVRGYLDPSFNVRAVAVEAIAGSPSGKFEDYLSLVPRQQTNLEGAGTTPGVSIDREPKY